MVRAIRVMVILCGVAAAILVGLIPPWNYFSDFTCLDTTAKTERPAGYYFIGNPPQPLPNPVVQLMANGNSLFAMRDLGSGVRIDVVRLGIEYLTLLIIEAALLYLIRSATKPVVPTNSAPASLQQPNRLSGFVYKIVWLMMWAWAIGTPIGVAIVWLCLRNGTTLAASAFAVISGCSTGAAFGYGINKLYKIQHKYWRLSGIAWAVFFGCMVGLIASNLFMQNNTDRVGVILPQIGTCVGAGIMACILSNVMFFVFNGSKDAANRAFCYTLLLLCVASAYQTEQMCERGQYDQKLTRAKAVLAEQTRLANLAFQSILNAGSGNASQTTSGTITKWTPPAADFTPNSQQPWTPPATDRVATPTPQGAPSPSGIKWDSPASQPPPNNNDPWAGLASPIAAQQQPQQPNAQPKQSPSTPAWSPPAKDFQQSDKTVQQTQQDTSWLKNYVKSGAQQQ
jgi:hypothetical protein